MPASASTRRFLTAATCAMGTFTANINNTALNLAIPTIRRDLGLSGDEVQWLASAYVLVAAACVMFGGALGDRFDKRRVLLVALVIYVAGSAFGIGAPTGTALIGSRVVAAVGGSVLVPVGLAIMRTIAQDSRQLAAYMSAWGLSVGLGMAAGPVVGGVVTGLFGWRAFFATMTILGAVFFACALAFLPHVPGDVDRHVLHWSHPLLALAMLSFTAFLVELQTPDSAALTMGCAGAFAASFGLWLISERRSVAPVVPPQVFRDRSFTVSIALSACNYIALGGALFAGSLYLQDHVGLSAVAAGAASLPVAVGNAAGAQWSGRALAKRTPTTIMRVAAGIIILGCIVIAAGELAAAELPGYLAGTALLGFGAGAANTPVNVLSMSSLPKALSGVAGSFASASRQLGQSTGVTVDGLLLSAGGALAAVLNARGTPDGAAAGGAGSHASSGAGAIASSAVAFSLPLAGVVVMAVIMLTLPALYRPRSERRVGR